MEWAGSKQDDWAAQVRATNPARPPCAPPQAFTQAAAAAAAAAVDAAVAAVAQGGAWAWVWGGTRGCHPERPCCGRTPRPHPRPRPCPRRRPHPSPPPHCHIPQSWQRRQTPPRGPRWLPRAPEGRTGSRKTPSVLALRSCPQRLPWTIVRHGAAGRQARRRHLGLIIAPCLFVIAMSARGGGRAALCRWCRPATHQAVPRPGPAPNPTHRTVPRPTRAAAAVSGHHGGHEVRAQRMARACGQGRRGRVRLGRPIAGLA